ncbi:MAG TPA: hypothetical protein VF494_11955, partial [Candidatus Limnocylindrales bacterium]
MISKTQHLARILGSRLAPTLALAAVLASCTSGGTAATPGSAATPPVIATPPPSAVPSEPVVNPPDGGVPGGGDTVVVPKPGQLDVHPIAADSFAARVDGRHVILTITYTSGVEPCSVLDTIVVQRGEGSFAIT